MRATRDHVDTGQWCDVGPGGKWLRRESTEFSVSICAATPVCGIGTTMGFGDDEQQTSDGGAGSTSVDCGESVGGEVTTEAPSECIMVQLACPVIVSKPKIYKPKRRMKPRRSCLKA